MSGRRDSDAPAILGRDLPRRSKATNTSTHPRRSDTRTEVLRSHSTDNVRRTCNYNPDGFPPNDAQPSRFMRWLRHPLLYFLLIGVMLFTAYSTRSAHSAGEDIRHRHTESASVWASSNNILLPQLVGNVTRETSLQMAVAERYLSHGIETVLNGPAHLLFLLALLLLVRGRRRLAAAVVAFTVAHSFTLTAAALGFVHIPQKPVAAAIALSVVFVAAEVVCRQQGIWSATKSSPWMTVFVFGWLHGFGFADALCNAVDPQQLAPETLFFFNAGVELGQIFFLGCALTAFGAVRWTVHHIRWLQPFWNCRVLPCAIGMIAAVLFIQRLAAF